MVLTEPVYRIGEVDASLMASHVLDHRVAVNKIEVLASQLLGWITCVSRYVTYLGLPNQLSV
jgi:hypothetical protein